jgi:hypothetical protein
VPLARDLHPEFGYVGSPGLRRKHGLALTFVVFGLLAIAGGVAVFMADPDPGPMHAMALAPAEALDPVTRSSPTATAETKAVEATLAQNISKVGGIKSPCRENTTEQGDCSSGKADKPRPAPPVNERPAIAAVLIGHSDGPAVRPAEPEIPVAATPDIPESSAKPVDTADTSPASVLKESPTPAASAKQSQTRSNSVQRRDRDDGNFVERRDRDDSNSVNRRDRGEHSSPRSYSSQDEQGGYARLWLTSPCWPSATYR